MKRKFKNLLSINMLIFTISIFYFPFLKLPKISVSIKHAIANIDFIIINSPFFAVKIFIFFNQVVLFERILHVLHANWIPFQIINLKKKKTSNLVFLNVFLFAFLIISIFLSLFSLEELIFEFTL